MNEALLSALHSGRLITEDGTEEIVDFNDRGLDRLDFTSVSRGNLRRMLEAAYLAGFNAGRS